MAEKPRVTPIRRGNTTRAPRLSVAAAAERGDERAVLVALQRRVAAVIDTAGPRDLAALSRRLLDLTGALATLDARAADEAERAPPRPRGRAGRSDEL
jgi:hypothetical protein